MSTLTRLLLVALALPALPAAAQDGICRRDLLIAESLQRTALDRLEAAGVGEVAECRAWREHVATMRRAAAIYRRCLDGETRGVKLTQTEGPASEFEGLVRQRCR